MSNDSSLIFDNLPGQAILDSYSPRSLNRFNRNKDDDEHSRSRSREHEDFSFKYSTMLHFEQNHQFAPKISPVSSQEHLDEDNPDGKIKKKRIRLHKRKRKNRKPRIRHRPQDQPLIAANLPNVPFAFENIQLGPLGAEEGEDDELEVGEIRRVEVNSDDDSITETKPSYSEVRMQSGSENAGHNNTRIGTSNDLFVSTFDENRTEEKSEVRQTMEIECDRNRQVADILPCFLQNLEVNNNKGFQREFLKTVPNKNNSFIVIPDNETFQQSRPSKSNSKKFFDSVKQSIEADIDLLFGDDEENDESPKVINVNSSDLDELFEPVEQEEEPFIQNKVIEEPFNPISSEETHQAEEPFFELPLESFSKNSIPLFQNNWLTDPRKKSSKAISSEEKLNLVLDLDETILNSHAFNSDFNVSSIKNISSGHLRTITSNEYKLVIIFRPYAFEFLRRISQYYNIYVYSHGRYEYVKNILALIDKEEQFIKREIIFKNIGQVCGNTPKLLSNLGLSPEQINKTLILDDQRHIWEQDHHRVICAKKFIPLKEFIKEEKYNRYLLFINKEQGNIRGTRWLTHNNDISELRHYSETHVAGHKTCQLEGLTHFLEGLAEEYIKRSNTKNASELGGIEELYEEKMKSILKGLKISVITASNTRKAMFEELGLLLGATMIDHDRAHILLIDDNLEQAQESLVQDLINQKPLLTVLSIFWLTECFFCLNKVPTYKFQCQH